MLPSADPASMVLLAAGVDDLATRAPQLKNSQAFFFGYDTSKAPSR